MRFISTILFLMGMTSVAMGDTYNIDTREYVSPTQVPYSSVVQLVQGNDGYCSGILTADGFVVTAKHCIVDRSNYPMSISNFRVIHPTQGALTLRGYIQTSDADAHNVDEYQGDWAIIATDHAPKSDVHVAELGGNGPTQVQLVGYGALKILSDTEIQNIRRAYQNFLRQNNIWLSFRAREILGGGRDMRARSQGGYRFVKAVRNGEFPDIDSKTFDDEDRLKMSSCTAQAKENIYGETLSGCQLWGGNSGGPVLKKINGVWYLYGVTATGMSYVSWDPTLDAHGVNMAYVNGFWGRYKQMLEWQKYNVSMRPSSNKSYKSAFD